jgi:hypothetical protein
MKACYQEHLNIRKNQLRLKETSIETKIRQQSEENKEIIFGKKICDSCRFFVKS